MTKGQAIKKADKRAKETGKTYFVVWDIDEYSGYDFTYHVADEEDRETFFSGVADRNIIYCTDEGEYTD